MTFFDLANKRKLLQAFCYRHSGSLEVFKSGLGYKLTQEAPDFEGLKHLTSTATCIESLLNCPVRFRSKEADPIERARVFARKAIARADDGWRSEESAAIYCRCRGLPLTIRFIDHFDRRIIGHLDRILKQLQEEKGRFAIGEADPNDKALSRADWYPPNAFHTYWTLEALRCFESGFSEDYTKFNRERNLEQLIPGMLLWTRRTLGAQIALHSAGSSVLDTDQLAWSLTTMLRFDKSFPADLSDQDLLREALKQLFSTQLKVGTWRHYRSLFHYKKAGNAYCFIYETFAALLATSVDERSDRKFLRDCLLPYGDNLQSLWAYAESTKVRLESSHAEPIGWCSGHRLNQTLPESWATASVFAFSHAYRRILGFWTREAALDGLNAVKPRLDTDPDTNLMQRGNSWILPPESGTSVVRLLYSLFLNPLRSGVWPEDRDANTSRDETDPDDEVIGPKQARSAILFGPPGASKTTLIRNLAAAIGWRYIEIHANHFVSDGMDKIHSKADEIFRRLMELDHTVVLFDEIDELVREREDGKEAFGRFLTTSMLPKLAELWEQRRTMYFVATNHIKYFDRAITRSQRFDALVMVALPSYEVKVEELKKLLGIVGVLKFEPDQQAFWAALQKAGSKKEAKSTASLSDDDILAKFILLRFDQLPELAAHLAKTSGDKPANVSTDDLKTALKQVRDGNLATCGSYIEFIEDIEYSRRDYDKWQVWGVEGITDNDEIALPLFRHADRIWIRIENGHEPPARLFDREVEVQDPATLRIMEFKPGNSQTPS